MIFDTTFSRRALLGAALSLAWSQTAHSETVVTGGIVSLDYGLASTLLALGVQPAAIAARADWDQLVVAPPLPDAVADLGMATEINIEALARLKPSLILSNPFLALLRPRLERIAPVREFVVYAPDRKALPAAMAATSDLGSALARETQAENFLQRSNQMFDDYRRRIAAIRPAPVALLTMMDERHARVYGGPGLYQGVLDRLGIANAWTRETTFWGFQTIALEELSALPADAHMMIFEPLMPPDILERLMSSPLWSSLPPVKAGRVSVLPGVLMFGMVNEALRFTDLITNRLEELA